MVIGGSSTLKKLFKFISTNFLFNGALYFYLTNLLWGKTFFKINFCLFLLSIS